MTKPRPLRRGDTVAVLSPSWGGPSVYPRVYERGLSALRDIFGLQVKQFPTARMEARYLYQNPRLRADDLNAAFADDEVRAIIATIGGDDSVRILPHLDAQVALDHPKILLGFSDTVAPLSFYSQRGLVTFHGPSVMSGFAQVANAPPAVAEHIRALLFDGGATYDYRPFSEWRDRDPDWSDEAGDGQLGPARRNEGWRWLQGSSVARGRLFGGCIEVLEFLKGTPFWPAASFWDDRILFLETSEDKPTPMQVQWMVRNYGMQGILDRIAGLLIGRAFGYSDEEKHRLDDLVLAVVQQEFGRRDIPVVSNMDFGHTSPAWILPLGIPAEIDETARTFRLVESPTSDAEIS